MITYRVIQSTPTEWIIERREPNHPPKFIWSGFRSAEQAQAHVDDLVAQERPERVVYS